MNLLTLIFNRIYFFLNKVKNQSPFIGTLILVTLLVCINIGNIELFVYAFKSEPLVLNYSIEFLIMIVVIVLLFFYAKNKKHLIIQMDIKSSTIKNFIVAFLFLFTLISFICLANINRIKIFKEQPHSFQNKDKRESIEGKIRKWFE